MILKKEQTEPARPQEVIPLENGDRLTAEEFERRYEAMPELKKAELIEGGEYVGSPVRLTLHGGPHSDLNWWLTTYRIATAGVRGGDNVTVRLDVDNQPQPDVLLFIEPKCGGQARISPDDYLEAAPELVAEVASSSASYDLHDKLEVYRRSQVREYLVWRVVDAEVDWFILRRGKYERLAPSAGGIYQSQVFPGLWLDPAALVHEDLNRVHVVLQQGIQSQEHAAFCARLQSTAPPAP